MIGVTLYYVIDRLCAHERHYHEHFMVVNIYPSHLLKNETEQGMLLALIEPANHGLFCEKMLDVHHADNERVCIEFPLNMLVLVVNSTLH